MIDYKLIGTMPICDGNWFYVNMHLFIIVFIYIQVL